MLKLTLLSWVMELMANAILDQVEDGGVAAVAENLKSIANTWLDGKRDEFVALLKAEGTKRWPESPLDDALIAAVEEFLDAILPQK